MMRACSPSILALRASQSCVHRETPLEECLLSSSLNKERESRPEKKRDRRNRNIRRHMRTYGDTREERQTLEERERERERWRAREKTLPCVPSKRSRVYVQNAPVCTFNIIGPNAVMAKFGLAISRTDARWDTIVHLFTHNMKIILAIR